jgi:hypothetical protein
VYTNGIKDDAPFNDVLRFKTKLISYDGNGSWIEPTLKSLVACLDSDTPPKCSESCAYCQFISKRMSSPESISTTATKVGKRMPKVALNTANKNAESDFAINFLESATDQRIPIDDLVINVIKANARRATLPNKKRVLEVIYGLQKSGMVKLENGVAMLI